jgi:hypothetical protein
LLQRLGFDGRVAGDLPRCVGFHAV